MAKILSFIKLDFITIKQNLSTRNLIVMAIVFTVVTLSSAGSGMAGLSIFIVYASLFATFPFAIGEKCDIDNLYVSLSLKRETVVLGRYLFVIFFDVIAGIVAFAYAYIMYTILSFEFDMREALIVILVMLIICSIIQTIQVPIFFRLGYSKAKLYAFLPFAGLIAFSALSASVFVKTNFVERNAHLLAWVANNQFIAGLIGLLIWLGIMMISYRVAVMLYKKRDF